MLSFAMLSVLAPIRARRRRRTLRQHVKGNVDAQEDGWSAGYPNRNLRMVPLWAVPGCLIGL